MNNKSVKSLAVCGMCLALACVTSLIKVFSLPTGGSVTLLSMFFITVVGYFYGFRTGIVAAIAYGALQFVLKPEMYTPIQVLTDYILAFGSLGLSGLFKCSEKSSYNIIWGYLLGITGRFIFSTISGAVFFAEYAWEGWNPFLYSAVYNGIYIYAEGVITVIILMIPAFRKAIDRCRIISE